MLYGAEIRLEERNYVILIATNRTIPLTILKKLAHSEEECSLFEF